MVAFDDQRSTFDLLNFWILTQHLHMRDEQTDSELRSLTFKI